VFRVTARKDQWNEVIDQPGGKPGWICNTCRFHKKNTGDWIIEGPTKINRHSVISQGHYIGIVEPNDPLNKVLAGRQPQLLMDIHNESEVNQPEVHLAELAGPATWKTFNGEPLSTGHNVTDVKQGTGANKQGTDSTNPNTHSN